MFGWLSNELGVDQSLDGPRCSKALRFGRSAVGRFAFDYGVWLVCAVQRGGQSLDRVYAQAIRLGVGLVLMVIVAQFHPHRIRQLTPLGYGFGVILLIGVLLIGVESKGAQRWLQIPAYRNSSLASL